MEIEQTSESEIIVMNQIAGVDTYDREAINRQRMQWIGNIASMGVRDAVEEWLSNLNPGTARNYGYYMSDLMRRGLIFAGTVSDFNAMPHEKILDEIKKIDGIGEGHRQTLCACYISFTGYLSRITQGWFRKAQPSTLASNPTFFSVTDKAKTEALTLIEAHRFLSALDDLNHRDGLIAKAMLQGAKRISEVLSLKIEQIDFDKSLIRFVQSKNGGTLKEIPTSFPSLYMDALRAYIEATKEARGTSDFVFITRNGKMLTRTRLNHSFEETSKRLGWLKYDAEMKKWVGRKVSPHCLRATWVTVAKQNGASDSDIMAVTGHTSSKMVLYYDKSALEDNLSKRLILV